MTQVGNRNFRGISEAQIEQIRKRCHTELYGIISKDLGLDFRRVGEVVKHLGIKRQRWQWGPDMRPYEALYHIVHTEARRGSRNIPVSLSYEEFLEFTKATACYYCGSPLVWAERIRHKEYVGTNLDRKDNSLGYSKENCVACCGSCNRTKGDRFTYEEFLIIGHSIRTVLWRRSHV
jgi:hypothetical protein